MVQALEGQIDDVSARFEPPTEFVVPGESLVAAQLDVARTVIRRAERVSIRAAAPGSHVVPYLNRLSDLVWTLARWQEGHSLITRDA
jgi:cob(I)alamin adenosyltransferase